MNILKRLGRVWKLALCLLGLAALTGCADAYYGYSNPGWGAGYAGVYYDPGFYGYYGPDYFDYYGPYDGGFYGFRGRGFHDFDPDRRFGHARGGFGGHRALNGRGGFARGSRGGSFAHGGTSHGGRGGRGR